MGRRRRWWWWWCGCRSGMFVWLTSVNSNHSRTSKVIWPGPGRRTSRSERVELLSDSDGRSDRLWSPSACGGFRDAADFWAWALQYLGQCKKLDAVPLTWCRCVNCTWMEYMMILKQDTANSLGSHRWWLSKCLKTEDTKIISWFIFSHDHQQQLLLQRSYCCCPPTGEDWGTCCPHMILLHMYQVQSLSISIALTDEVICSDDSPNWHQTSRRDHTGYSWMLSKSQFGGIYRNYMQK